MPQPKRLSLSLEATALHEAKHKDIDRLYKKWNVEKVSTADNEILAELYSLKEAREPWHVLAHIIREASVRSKQWQSDYFWQILINLYKTDTGELTSPPKQSLLNWLETIPETMSTTRLKEIAQKSYTKTEQYWRNKF